MECFSYEGGCGVYEHMLIETFKKRGGLSYGLMDSGC